MKKAVLYIIALLFFAAPAMAQGPAIITEELCWEISDTQDSTIVGYYLYTSRGTEPKLMNYLDASGAPVTITGGTVRVGACKEQIDVGAQQLVFVYNLDEGENYTLPADTLEKYNFLFFYMESVPGPPVDTTVVLLPEVANVGSRYLGKNLYFYGGGDAAQVNTSAPCVIRTPDPGDDPGSDSDILRTDCDTIGTISRWDTLFTAEADQRFVRYSTVPTGEFISYLRECEITYLLGADGNRINPGDTIPEKSYIDDNFAWQVDSVQEILTGSYKLGDRIQVRSTGLEYFVQADSVEFYVTDNINVIDLNGKYAVINLGKLRSFSNLNQFENKIHFVEFDDGEIIKIGGRSYEIRTYPKRFETAEDSLYLDTIPVLGIMDTVSFRHKKINAFLSHYPQNPFFPKILENDSGYVDRPYNFYSGAKFVKNAAKSPYGEFNAGLLAPKVNTQGIGIRFDTKPLKINDSITISFYYKFSNYDSSFFQSPRIRNIVGDGLAGLPNEVLLNPNGEWNKLTMTGLYIGNQEKYGQLFFNLVPLEDREILLADFSMQTGRKAPGLVHRDLAFSDNSKIYLYPVFETVGTTLDLRNAISDEVAPDIEADVQPLIQSAIDYCKEGRRCNYIILPKGTYNCEAPIVLNRGVTLMGEAQGSRSFNSHQPMADLKTILKFTFRDTTKDAFTVIEKDTRQTAVDNVGLKNLTISVADSGQVRNILYTEELNSSNFDNIAITYDGTSIVTGSGWLLTGPKDGDSGDPHYNFFNRIEVSSPNAALVYEAGIGSKFSLVNVTGDTGVVVRGGRFIVDNLSFEEANTGIFVSGRTAIASVYGLHSESSAGSGGVAIHLHDGILRLTDVRLQVEPGVFGKLLQADQNADQLIIDGAFEFIEGDIDIAEGVECVFRNVSSVNSIYERTIGRNPNLKDYVTIISNEVSYDNTKIHKFKSSLAPFLNSGSGLSDVYLKDSWSIDTTRYVKSTFLGYSENMNSKSEEIWTDLSTANFSAFSDSLIAPDGTKTAELIVAKQDFSSSFVSNDPSLFEPVDSTTKYTLSAWVKKYVHPDSVLTNDEVSLTVQVGIPGTGVELTTRDTFWRRVSLSFYPEGNGSFYNIRFNRAVIGQGIAVWGLQLNKTEHALPYFKTTTTGFREEIPTINIPNNLRFENGNISASNIDTLQTPSYANLYITSADPDTLVYTADDKEPLRDFTTTLSTHWSYNPTNGHLTYTGKDETAVIQYTADATVAVTADYDFAVYKNGTEIAQLADTKSYTATETKTHDDEAIIALTSGDYLFFEGRFPGGNQTTDVIFPDVSIIIRRIE